MTTFAKDWFRNLAYLITPENALMVPQNKKVTRWHPPSNPTGLETLKSVFWIAISIGFSLLISHHF